MNDYYLIPVIWVHGLLWTAAIFGVLQGFFSFMMPGLSIRLYEWMMARVHWKVEPEDPVRELRMTRMLGLITFILSLAMGYFLIINLNSTTAFGGVPPGGGKI